MKDGQLIFEVWILISQKKFDESSALSMVIIFNIVRPSLSKCYQLSGTNTELALEQFLRVQESAYRCILTFLLE
jgi:hypothetical protein